MAKRIIEMHTVTPTFAAGSNFMVQLGPKPYTITRIGINLKLTVSTGATPGTYNDPWDRVLTALALSSGGYSYFDFRDMRLARHIGRLEGHQIRAPAGLAASQSNVTVNVPYNIHFGVQPTKVDLVKGVLTDNPWDLTAGVPPRDQALVLTGTWGPANAPGSGYTISSGIMQIILFGVQPDTGDNPSEYMPLARPRFFTDVIASPGASSAFSQTYNVPIGDFLYSTLVMTTAGSPDARTLGVFNSFAAQANPPNMRFISFIDDDPFAIFTQANQLGEDGWPPADDPASPGSFTLNKVVDEGLYWFYWAGITTVGHPLYGFDMRQAQLSALQFYYGTAAAGTIWILHKKYQLLG
jgi:hypothetical protein